MSHSASRPRPTGLLPAMAAAVLGLTPAGAQACACGCGVFDIGTANLFPNGGGDTVFGEVTYMDQSRNMHGASSAPAAENPDKAIRTTFAAIGWQHMVDRRWGVSVELPVGWRTFRSDDGGGIETHRDQGLGDLKITGVYTGFSPDMSMGVTFGLKLPTGKWKSLGFDRDTQLGAGATDVMLGAYRLGHFGRMGEVGWFARATLDQPVASQGGYRPGAEADAAVGLYHSGWSLGRVFRLRPIVQAIGSWRRPDSGAEADPGRTGYQRVVLSPGLELQAKEWRLNGDVGLPVYQRVKGDQLTAPALFKVVLSRSF